MVVPSPQGEKADKGDTRQRPEDDQPLWHRIGEETCPQGVRNLERKRYVYISIRI